MGREVMRVPLDFVFPLGESYADACHDQLMVEHVKTCAKSDHEDCDTPYWRDCMPKGDGWQLWQTVSDGPVTPVFATADELVDYMCQPCDCGKRWCEDPWPSMPAGKGWRREVAEPFVKKHGWAPSGIVVGGHLMFGAEAVVAHGKTTTEKEPGT